MTIGMVIDVSATLFMKKGYRYIEGRWERVAKALCMHYSLPANAKILESILGVAKDICSMELVLAVYHHK